jgi:hypothetical protein
MIDGHGSAPAITVKKKKIKEAFAQKISDYADEYGDRF